MLHETLMGKLHQLLLAMLSLVQYSLWLAETSIQDYIHINKDIVTQQNKNATLKACNDHLFTASHYLNKEQEALEDSARNGLGMIKTGETFLSSGFLNSIIPIWSLIYRIKFKNST